MTRRLKMTDMMGELRSFFTQPYEGRHSDIRLREMLVSVKDQEYLEHVLLPYALARIQEWPLTDSLCYSTQSSSTPIKKTNPLLRLYRQARIYHRAQSSGSSIYLDPNLQVQDLFLEAPSLEPAIQTLEHMRPGGLRSLYLNINPRVVDCLAPAGVLLPQISQLHTLRLRLQGIHNFEGWEIFPEITTLRALELKMSLTPQNTFQLAKISLLKQLEHLHIISPLDEDAKRNLNALALVDGNLSLTSLTLDSASLSESAFQELISKCPDLNHLSLSAGDILTLEAILASPKVPSLESLSLHAYGQRRNWCTREVQSLFRTMALPALRRVKTLRLRMMALSHLSLVRILSESDWTSLEELDLYGNPLSTETLTYLQALVHVGRLPSLRKLGLYRTTINLTLGQIKRNYPGLAHVEIGIPL